MIGRIPRWLFVVGIVIATSGCDNVSWGGVDLRLRGPSDDTTSIQQDTAPALATPEPATDLGPLLYAGVRTGNRARVVPVAEITQDGLRPLALGTEGEEQNHRILQSRLRPGEDLTLFHQGVRVGTLVIDETEVVADTYCQPRAQASGQLLLTPEASGAQRFLALERARGRNHSFGPYQELSSVYDQRVGSLNMGAEAVSLVGAPWPPALLDIRQDLQILALSGGVAPAVMATFVYRDQLQVGPAPDQAYALMVLGEPRGARFDLAFTWYRPVGAQGKGAPRYFSRMDWDGDGEEEILLEVMGTESRWFAALDRGVGGWVMSYQDPCGTPGARDGGG